MGVFFKDAFPLPKIGCSAADSRQCSSEVRIKLLLWAGLWPGRFLRPHIQNIQCRVGKIHLLAIPFSYSQVVFKLTHGSHLMNPQNKTTHPSKKKKTKQKQKTTLDKVWSASHMKDILFFNLAHKGFTVSCCCIDCSN